MNLTPEQLVAQARQYMLNAKTFVKEHPVEEFVKHLIFSMYVFYRSREKLLPSERREFKELIDRGLNLVNLDQRVKTVMVDPLSYDYGEELGLIDILKRLPALLKADMSVANERRVKELRENKQSKLDKALAMLDKSRFDGALNQFFQLSEAHPDDYELHKDISWKLYEIKHIESTTFLERTVAINPYDSESWAALGHVYRKLKKYEDAARAYRQALSIEVDNTTYMFNLSRVYIDSRQWQLARTQLEQLLAIEPDMVIAIQALKFVSSSLKL